MPHWFPVMNGCPVMRGSAVSARPFARCPGCADDVIYQGVLRRALKTAGVSTRRGLASLDVLPGGNGVSRQSLEGARLPARLQVASEDEGRIRYEILDPERDLAGVLLRQHVSVTT